jgi:hypothetical protein
MPATAAQPIDPYETATDQAIAACDGDVRAALKAALIAMAMLESELSEVYAAVERRYGLPR